MVQASARQHAASFFPSLGGDLPTIVRAQGIYLYDDAGRQMIDAAGGVGAVTSIGHAVPEVVEALTQQLRTVAFVPWTQFQTEPAQRLAEAIAEATPRGLNSVALFTGGSEVTEGAVKLARQHWLARGKSDKYLVVSRWQGFHGMTLGATGFSGHTQRRRKYQPLIQDMPKIGPAYAYRCDDCAGGSLRCADELERTIRWYGPENVSCFIAEPVVGATMGAVPAPPGYFQRIRQICDRYDVLLIADEVMTGFGRTGRWFGLDHWGVRPDLLVAAKGATSGYWPFGFVAASADVHDTVTGAGGFTHGFTYSHAPVGAAVAREVLRILESEDLVEASATKGVRLLELLEARLGAHPNVGEIRGRGLLVGVELVTDRSTRAAFPRSARLTEAIVRGARSRGLLVYSSTGNADGVNGDLIVLGPPFVVTDDELVRIAAALGDSVEEAVVGLDAAAIAGGRSHGAVAESPAG